MQEDVWDAFSEVRAERYDALEATVRAEIRRRAGNLDPRDEDRLTHRVIDASMKATLEWYCIAAELMPPPHQLWDYPPST